MTELIKRKLQDEINALEHELVHELPKEIKKAAALGDLSENAEYHMAKQRQEFVKARVRQLGKRLADLSMVNMNNIPRDKVGLGSTVKVFDNTKNEEMEYNIVTSEESDVAAGKISTNSPIGRALLNKKVGDTAVVVTPGGSRELEILKLATIHDVAKLPAWRYDLDQRLRKGLRSFVADDCPLARAHQNQSQRAHVHGTGGQHLGSVLFRIGNRREPEAHVFLCRADHHRLGIL